jgi:diguanylate cyclase (GGDEF)-like protein/PAS domain S-box-containing protein
MENIKILSLFRPFYLHIRKENFKKLLDQLHYNAQKSMAILVILSLIIYIFLKDSVPGYIINTWFVATVSLSLVRLYDSYHYFKVRSCIEHIKCYKNFANKAFLTAFLWGCTAIVFIPYLKNSNELLLVDIILLGLSGGALNSLAPDMRISTIYNLLLLIPLIVSFLMFGSPIGYALALMGLVFIYMIISINLKAKEAIMEACKHEMELRKMQSDLLVKQDELKSLFKQAPIGIFYFNTDYKVIDHNQAFGELFHVGNDGLIGLDLSSIPDQRPLASIRDALNKLSTQYYAGPYRSIKGLDLWIEAKISPVVNPKGEILGGIALIENKTNEKQAHDELEYFAVHDPLTSLANRRALIRYMNDLILQPRHKDQFSVLLFLDLNRFKHINDTMGHNAGDELLIQVAERLDSLAEEGYSLNRIGGDEFIIVMPFVSKDMEQTYKTSQIFAGQIKELFADTFVIQGMHLSVTCSLGIVIIEPDQSDIEEIIRHADISMYQAKHNGGDAPCYYSAEMDIKRKEHFLLQHDFGFAVANDQLELYFQPIARYHDDGVVAAESLLRWNHPQRGMLYPDQFMYLAAESGMADWIGWWVVEHVCRQISQWKSQKIYNIQYVSINIDILQLENSHFLQIFLSKIKFYGIEPSEIRLEFSEHSLFKDYNKIEKAIFALQEHGIDCAIDNFGTKYSSLSQLKDLSFSTLKIDSRFVKDIDQSSDDLYLLQSMINTGKKLDYEIVLKGIETTKQKDSLDKSDTKLYYQGWLFGPAMTVKEFEDKFLTKT